MCPSPRQRLLVLLIFGGLAGSTPGQAAALSRPGDTSNLGLATHSGLSSYDAAAAYLDLGLAMFRAGRPERALRALERAVEYSCGSAPTRAALALTLWTLRRNESALAVFEHPQHRRSDAVATYRSDRRWNSSMLAELEFIHTRFQRALSQRRLPDR